MAEPAPAGEGLAWLALWRAQGDVPALVDGARGEVWSARRLADEVEQRASGGRLAGVRPGDVVLLRGHGGPGLVAGLWAVLEQRAVVAPAVDRSAERATQLAEAAGARWELDEAGNWVATTRRHTPGEAARWAEILRDRGHAGLILFTSGTTGRPKGVVHDADLHLAGWRQSARAGATRRRVLALLRLDQIGGLDVLGRALAGGSAVVLPTTRDPEAIASLIRRERVDVLPASPSFLHLLLQAEGGPELADSALRLVPYGAEAMPPARLARLRAAWPQVEFLQRFGTTETGAVRVLPAGADGLGLRPEDPEVQWRIAEGELQIRSPRQLLGYLDPEDGKETLTEDGWYRTGDLAEPTPDEGFSLRGRRVAQINVGGRKVRPEAVEAVLLEHPDVVAVKVSGRPHAMLGAEVVAEVEVRPGGPAPVILRAGLRSWAAARLEAHEVPTRWVWASVAVDPVTWKVKRGG